MEETREYVHIDAFLRNPANAKRLVSLAYQEILKSDMTCWEKTSRVVNKLLHSHTTQAILLFLVLVDCAVIACEIVFDEKVKTHYDYCGANSTLCQEEIDNEQTKKWKKIYKALYYTSLTLLSVFVVEFILKITFSAKKFLKSWVHIFDALIVMSSWILMLIMLNKDVKNGMIAEFLIAFRVIRLIHGMKEALEEANELLHENLTEEIHALKAENKKLKEELLAVKDR